MQDNNQSHTKPTKPMRRQDDVTLQVIADNMSMMHEDVSGLRESVQESLKDISIALQSLVALEQKQIHQSITQQRFDEELKSIKQDVKELDKRVDEVAIAMPELKRTSSWIFSAVIAVLSAAGMFAGKMLGIY
jgi:methyl-accepting chemotaxis protein